MDYLHKPELVLAGLSLSRGQYFCLFRLVVLRNYVALAIFQPYRDLEAGDNQSLKSKSREPGSNPAGCNPFSVNRELKPPCHPAPSAIAQSPCIRIPAAETTAYGCYDTRKGRNQDRAESSFNAERGNRWVLWCSSVVSSNYRLIYILTKT